MNEGRKEQEAKLLELRDDLKAVATENERLDGIAASARDRVADLERLLARAEADRQAAQLASSEAGAQTARALQRLADAQSAHASQVATLQAKLDEAVARAHHLELELVRAQARLEVKGVKCTATA